MGKVQTTGLLFLAAFLFVVAETIPGLAAPEIPPRLAQRADELDDRNALDLLLSDIADQRALLVRIQRELVKRPGINPEDGGDGEENKVRWIEDWLAAEGLPPAERLDYPDDRVPSKVRPNLILRHPQPPRDGPTLWVVAYLDNASAGDPDAWAGSPFSLRVDGDTMHGLGFQDNNDAIAAALLVFRSLHRHRSAAALNLGVLLVAGEKQGSKVGFEYLVRRRPALFGRTDQFLVLSYGLEAGDVMEVGEKGVLFLKLTVRGKQSHAALPHKGRNALAAGAELIAALSRLGDEFPERDPLFDPPHATFTPTRPEVVASSYNQVPGIFAFHLDMRLLPPHRPEEMLAAVDSLAERVREKYGVEVLVEQLQLLPPSPTTAADAPMVLAVGRAIREQLGREPVLTGIGGVTIAAGLRRMGYSPVVWRMAPFQEHSADESMSISANLAEAALIARLLFDRELAAASAPRGPEP